MAHFARMENDHVVEVIVVSNENCGNKEFPESEPIGQAYLKEIGVPGYWLQTSYNATFRGCYAGIGFTYDKISDVFVCPPPPVLTAE